jgi:hypothetical protein
VSEAGRAEEVRRMVQASLQYHKVILYYDSLRPAALLRYSNNLAPKVSGRGECLERSNYREFFRRPR